MTTYKFNPAATAYNVDWNTPADWLPAVTPNSADADVVIPLIISNGYPYNFGVSERKLRVVCFPHRHGGVWRGPQRQR